MSQALRLETEASGRGPRWRGGRPEGARACWGGLGQMLVLFAISIFVLTGITAIVVDISWYWANSLRVQRAADAAALAGVVWLPGSPSTGYSTARTEASKNGYTGGTGAVTVSPIQDSAAKSGGNPRQLDVTVTAPVGTFFMRIFGISTIPASRFSRAEFVLRVPMGAPRVSTVSIA